MSNYRGLKVFFYPSVGGFKKQKTYIGCGSVACRTSQSNAWKLVEGLYYAHVRSNAGHIGAQSALVSNFVDKYVRGTRVLCCLQQSERFHKKHNYCSQQSVASSTITSISNSHTRNNSLVFIIPRAWDTRKSVEHTQTRDRFRRRQKNTKKLNNENDVALQNCPRAAA